MEPTLDAVHPVLMSRDVTRSIRFYETLGFTLAGQDAPHDPKYARIQRDQVELHLQWHDAKEWDYPNDRPTYRFVVFDVDGLFKQFRANAGVCEIKSVSDTPWGTREFHVRDPDLNGLQFYRWL
jgi:catechol 2,3-dioxygenase-like lactoylglutathione lyase family enzyme